jgi:hypothetical protein
MNRQGSTDVVIVLLIVVVILFGVGVSYLSMRSSQLPSSASAVQNTQHNSSTSPPFLSSTEYQTSYGYRFTYSDTFRLAVDYSKYVNSLAGQGHVALTMASVEQEDSYIAQVSSSISEYTSSGLLMLPDFFVNQSILIGIAPGSYSDLEASIIKLASVEFQQQYLSVSGHQPPALISNLESVKTTDGVEGILYLYRDTDPVASSTPFSVRADLPYEPRSLRASVDYTAPAVVEFSFPITVTSSASSSESTLRQIVTSLEFD